MSKNRHTLSAIRLCVLLVFLSSLAGCNLPGNSSGGPTVWIDRPLNKSELPLQVVLIQAHASDSDGVAEFEFFAKDESIAIVPAGGERLGEATLQWQPPGEGVFSLGVRAVDNLGNPGEMTAVLINVSGAVSAKPTTTLASAIQTPMIVLSIDKVECGPDYKVAVDFTIISLQGVQSVELFSTYTAGEAQSKLTFQPPYPLTVKERMWFDEGEPDFADRPHQYGIKVWLVGESQPLFTYAYEPGEKQRCPGHYEGDLPQLAKTPAVSPSLSVITPTIQPPKKTIQPLPTATFELIPIDITPPGISELTADPALISVQSMCGATPPTTIITARVTDAGGIASVIVRVSGMGEYNMSPSGGDYFQAVLGPYTEAGTLTIFVQAQDIAGNKSTSTPVEIQVIQCPG